MDRGSTFFIQDRDMRVSGQMISSIKREYLVIVMEIDMREYTRMGRKQVGGYITTPMDLNIKGSGLEMHEVVMEQ